MLLKLERHDLNGGDRLVATQADYDIAFASWEGRLARQSHAGGCQQSRGAQLDKAEYPQRL
jgi:hypothetical protein